MSENVDETEGTPESPEVTAKDDSGSGPQNPGGGNGAKPADQSGVSGPQNPGGGN